MQYGIVECDRKTFLLKRIKNWKAEGIISGIINKNCIRKLFVCPTSGLNSQWENKFAH